MGSRENPTNKLAHWTTSNEGQRQQFSMRMRACLQEHVCMCWHGGGTEGTRGHIWGTCCGNRYMCGFIEGEAKAEGCSCSCLEGLIYANNKRKEVKSRNWPCATVIWVLQSAMHVSLTVRIIGICTSKTQQSNFRFSALFLLHGRCWEIHRKNKCWEIQIQCRKMIL